MNTLEKNAIVVGASGGIGSEIVKRLNRRGYRITLVDKDVRACEELAAQVRAAPIVQLDLTDRAAVEGLCQRIREEGERWDVAIFNAGIICPKSLIESSGRELDLQLEINLRSGIHVIQAFADSMCRRGAGHIITTVSQGGIISMKGSAVYSATKFGLRATLMALKSEIAHHGVKVSGVYPSGVDTQMLRFEARNGGSALNFVSVPQTVADIGNAFEKALDSGRLEVYPSWTDSLMTRFVASFPWLLPYILPFMEKLGEKGRTRYLERIGEEESG
ncbi:SDR family NAD(P)-dependent oxidoreductase [Alcanivoracaceae bacterium MT1]